jgi:thiol:disulfide interchange protein
VLNIKIQKVMKRVKTIFASVFFAVLLSVQTIAGNGSKVIAVINKADWCPTCEKNGERAMAAFMENNKDGAIHFVANDVTNDETKKKSAEELKKLGLDEKMAAYKGTGVAYFFDADTKTLVHQISVAKSNEELAEAMNKAKKEAE